MCIICRWHAVAIGLQRLAEVAMGVHGTRIHRRCGAIGTGAVAILSICGCGALSVGTGGEPVAESVSPHTNAQSTAQITSTSTATSSVAPTSTDVPAPDTTTGEAEAAPCYRYSETGPRGSFRPRSAGPGRTASFANEWPVKRCVHPKPPMFTPVTVQPNCTDRWRVSSRCRRPASRRVSGSRITATGVCGMPRGHPLECADET